MASSWSFRESLHRLHLRHERLKHSIHEGWRYPLPRWGRALMGVFYFSIPVVGGWYVMQWAISKSHASIGERGERLPVQTLQGMGNQRVIRTAVQQGGEDGEIVEQQQTVGAGGWGGGVNLAVSDEETQKRNRKMLNKFLRQQRRKLEKDESKKNGDVEDS